MPAERYLGVDGGGTKTAFCLLTGEGGVIAEAATGSAYYFTAGIELVGRVLGEGIAAVCEQAGMAPSDIDYAFFGLPAYGEASADVPALDAAPRPLLGHDRYACGNDMICGWAGSLAAADGINVIAGTGSMTYGERAGRGARVGGWGELFGDEGSAYWIAIRGLAAFTRMSDGRLPAGPLREVLEERLELAAPLDVVDVVLNRWGGDRGRIAALCPAVVAAAERGDACASEILADAARELAAIVDTTRMRLGFAPDEIVPVSYSGGVFQAGAAILGAFEAELDARHDRYELRRPLHTPAIGAALYAAKLNGTPLDPAALRHVDPSSPATAGRHA